MFFPSRAAAILAVAVACSAASQAQAKKSWKFEVHNKSQTAAVEFRTQEDGQWSSNWITERIEPGDTFNMDFGTDEGNCTVRTQIRFLDGSYFDGDVNYCKASNLYLYENKLTWD